MREGQPSRVSYSQSVKINIGDYESKDIFLNYASDLKKGETFNQAVDRIQKIVDARILIMERKIRNQFEDNVEFQTLKKLL